jgi:SAM-dependent methyltransferase
MTDHGTSAPTASSHMAGEESRYSTRHYWGEENLRFINPHFRLGKAVRLINKLAREREVDLLDIGCGPATVSHLVTPKVHYFGIDIAIQAPARNLLESDLTKEPIRFGDQRFDIVLGQGVFEYLGTTQETKFAEIAEILRPDGTFIASYWNFGHRNRVIDRAINNVQTQAEFRASLRRHFTVQKSYPVSHNWPQHEPGRKALRGLQVYLNPNVPVLSPKFAVEYFYICSPR